MLRVHPHVLHVAQETLTPEKKTRVVTGRRSHWRIFLSMMMNEVSLGVRQEV